MSDTTLDTDATPDTVAAEIGFAAGDVYRYLFTNGETSVTKLSKSLGLPKSRIDLALGWLAREKKIRFAVEKRTVSVSLQ